MDTSKYEDMAPEDLCKACREKMKNNKDYLAVGAPFEETWPKVKGLNSLNDQAGTAVRSPCRSPSKSA